MARANKAPSRFATPGGLLRVLGTLIALALVVYLVAQQGWQEIANAVARIELWRFVVAIILTFISRVAVARRWHVLLRSGGVDASWSQSLRITFAGLFANNFLPTTVGGDVARMAGALQVGFDATVSAASLVVDRLVGLLGFAFTLPIGLQFLTSPGQQAAHAEPLTIMAAQTSWIARATNIVRKISDRLIRAIRLWVSQPRALLNALFFTFIHMACLFSTLYMFLLGMGEQQLSFWDVAGLQSLVYIFTLIPISISGWGLQELSISYAFTTLGHVDPAHSLVLALLLRTLYLLVSLPGALFLSSVLPGMAKAQPLLTKLDG